MPSPRSEAAGADRVRWLEETLMRALSPEHLEVVDDSARHAGHAGAASGGGHYRVLIVSESFRGRDLISRQRAVYAALGDAMQTTVHALELQTLTPEEWQRRGSPAARARTNRTG